MQTKTALTNNKVQITI